MVRGGAIKTLISVVAGAVIGSLSGFLSSWWLKRLDRQSALANVRAAFWAETRSLSELLKDDFERAVSWRDSAELWGKSKVGPDWPIRVSEDYLRVLFESARVSRSPWPHFANHKPVHEP